MSDAGSPSSHATAAAVRGSVCAAQSAAQVAPMAGESGPGHGVDVLPPQQRQPADGLQQQHRRLVVAERLDHVGHEVPVTLQQPRWPQH